MTGSDLNTSDPCARRDWLACTESAQKLLSTLGGRLTEGQLRDLDRARAWLESSCENSELNACTWLGQIHERMGRLPEARAVFRKSCVAGPLENKGCFALLRLPLPPAEHAELRAWMGAACEGGSADACGAAALERLRSSFDPRAFVALNRACEQGSRDSCMSYGEVSGTLVLAALGLALLAGLGLILKRSARGKPTRT